MGLFMSPACPSPSSWKTQMQINQFHSNFSYKNVCKQPLNMEWQALTEFGKAHFWRSGFIRRLKQNCNWKSCFLWLVPCSLNWEKGLFLVLFLVVCALLPQLVIHSCFARSFLVNSGQIDWVFFKQNQSWEHSCLSFDGKRDFYVCSCVHLYFKTVTSKYSTRKRDSCLVSAFHRSWLQGQASTIAQQRKIIPQAW